MDVNNVHGCILPSVKSSDQKIATQLYHPALKEYGQILNHPLLFGEMPSAEVCFALLSTAKWNVCNIVFDSAL